MEILITEMVKGDYSMSNLSGSIAEHGNNATQHTWGNSKDYAKEHSLLTTPEMIFEAKRFFKNMGIENIDSHSNEDIQALTIQYIAGDIREFKRYESIDDYEKASNEGQVSGRIFYVSNDADYYIYIGE